MDEFTPATRYLVVATKSARRWFDLDAVREDPVSKPQRHFTPHPVGHRSADTGEDGGRNFLCDEPLIKANPAGAPPLDWWTVPDLYEPPKGVTMGMATWYQGDALTVLRTLPSGSVDLVMTSPPFLALRSYLPADHEHKALEIGSEGTPGAFLDVLLDVTEELGRVLAPHGSLVVELGDTYSGSGIEKREDVAEGSSRFGGRDGMPTLPGAHGGTVERRGDGWPLAKSLCMIPSSYAWALAYGRNPWTGRTTPPWRVRNLIAWCRPNPPVGALGDKFRPGTSYLTVACKSAGRYFDLDAVREPFKGPERFIENTYEDRKREGASESARGGGLTVRKNTHGGAPPLDWWEIPTHPYPGAHYATFPPQLCVRPIKAMCPQRVCRVCGRPSERITETTQLHNGKPRENDNDLYTKTRGDNQPRGDFGPMPDYVKVGGAPSFSTRVETLGWSDCGHDDWRTGIVLDPFAGSGTTLEVATGHGRDAIGVDLDPRNYDLARSRIGMFLSEPVDTPVHKKGRVR